MAIKDILKDIDTLSKNHPFLSILPHREFYTDDGSEFKSSQLTSFLAKQNIHRIMMVGSVKAFFAERVIRLYSHKKMRCTSQPHVLVVHKNIAALQKHD